MAGADLDTPLVGREVELDALRTAVESAAAGRARAVLLAGAGGSGKSRLVRELVKELDGGLTLVLRTQCVDLGDPGLPHLVLVDLARAIRAAGTEDSEVAAVLGRSPLVATLADSPVDGIGGAGGARDGLDESAPVRLYDAMVGLLGALGRSGRTVVVVIEDLQWLDSSSAGFLTFLLRRLADEHVAVVATLRSDGVPGRPRVRQLLSDVSRHGTVQRVDLEPFSEAEVTAYLEGLGGDPVKPAAAAEVTRRTGGNPYFVALLAAAGSGDRTVPRALSDLLIGRIDGLSSTARDLVRAVAVGAQPVPDTVLRRVVRKGGPLADDVLDGALREAISEAVLVPDGDGYALAHDLLRSAVHDDLLPGERQRLHAAYGEVLESWSANTANVAEVAHHWAAAQDALRALTWSVRAGEHAMELLAPVEALEQLERSLALWPVVENAAEVAGLTQAELVLRTSRAAGLAGERSRAIEWARAAVRHSDADEDAVTGVQARAELVRHLIAADTTDQLVALGEEAVRLASDLVGAGVTGDAGSAVASAHVTLARALLAARRTDEARPQVEHALAAAHSAGAKGLELDALTTVAFLDEIAGDVEGAAQRLRSAVSLARAEGELAAELRAYYTLACLHYYNGDVTGAMPVLHTALGRVSDTGLRWSDHGVELRILLAVARYAVGDLPGSLSAAATDHEGNPPDAPAARLAAVSCYAAVAMGAPDVDRRLADLDASWDTDPQVALVAGGCGADHLAWTGDLAGAVAMAERAQVHLDGTVGEGMYGGLWLSALGLAALADAAAVARRSREDGAVEVAVRQGEVLLARVARLVESGHGRPGALGPEGRAWQARAVAEHARLGGQPGVDEWRAAVTAFGYGHTYEQARSRWRLAEALVQTGDRDEARAQAEKAAGAAERLGAAPLQRAIAATMQSARLAPTAARPDGVLTRREREVLSLVAEGLTNREIGRRLYISEKTASVHLSNLMAKLNVSSRTEAVTVAVRRGLHDVT